MGGGVGGQRRLSNATKVNVNTANVFQLMKVQFITQNLAENIVTHRDRKGPFRCLDDLLKVKGIKVALFSAIRSYLVLSDEADPGGPAGRNHPRNELQMEKWKMNGLNDCRIGQMNQTSLNRVQLSQANNCPLDTNQSYISQVEPIQPQVNQSPVNRPSLSMHLLQLPGSHQHLDEPGRRSDHPSGRTHRTLRLASWNLDQCSLEKVENPGVREVVAMTILDNG